MPNNDGSTPPTIAEIARPQLQAHRAILAEAIERGAMGERGLSDAGQIAAMNAYANTIIALTVVGQLDPHWVANAPVAGSESDGDLEAARAPADRGIQRGS